jgi:hypothetical protein
MESRIKKVLVESILQQYRVTGLVLATGAAGVLLESVLV